MVVHTGIAEQARTTLSFDAPLQKTKQRGEYKLELMTIEVTLPRWVNRKTNDGNTITK